MPCTGRLPGQTVQGFLILSTIICMLKEYALSLVSKTRREVKSIVAYHLEGGELINDIEKAFADLEAKLADSQPALSEPPELETLADILEPYTTKEILAELDEDAIADYAREIGFICIQIDGLADQQKLDDFLRTEIFPTYNLQKANLY